MLIGRKKQQAELRDAYNSDDSKFVALYGRRRVGKTYLVKQTFKDEFTFFHSGLANGSLQEQLYGWRSSLEDAGLQVPSSPKHWLEAFDMLKELIRQSSAKKKVILSMKCLGWTRRGLSLLRHWSSSGMGGLRCGMMSCLSFVVRQHPGLSTRYSVIMAVCTIV